MIPNAAVLLAELSCRRPFGAHGELGIHPGKVRGEGQRLILLLNDCECKCVRLYDGRYVAYATSSAIITGHVLHDAAAADEDDDDGDNICSNV